MSKLFKNFVGVDISKTWFDAALIISADPSKIIHQQFYQTSEGYNKMQQWLRDHDVSLDGDTLFCMEYTGIYNTALVNYLVAQQAHLWVEMPLRIKRAGGLERGSDDKSAAFKIAWYALRYHDQAKLWKPADSSIEKIKHLITQRERVITSIKHLTVPAEELKECGCLQDAKMMDKLQQPAIKALQKTKHGIEALITKTIKQDEELNNKIQLIQSVSGIGTVTATALLAYVGFPYFSAGCN